MKIKNCPSVTCGRPFQLNTFTAKEQTWPGMGQVTCPHCGLSFAGDSNSLFLTHALSIDEEKRIFAERHENEKKAGKFSASKQVEVFWGEMAACEHFVQIYEDDATFIDTLESFVHEGLLAGDAAIVIATPEHLAHLEARLIANGMDVAAARLQDQYIGLDAKETLARFMVNGWPDDELFASTITDILARAQRKGRKVRAFGEMVALLWSQGHSAATVRLEHLWSHLCQRESFALFCAYPRVGFTENASESIAHVCAMHSRIIAA